MTITELEALTARDANALVSMLPDAPTSTTALHAAAGDPEALARILEDEEAVLSAFRSAVGPILAAPLCLRLVPTKDELAAAPLVLEGISGLQLPPLDQGVVLRRILWPLEQHPDLAAKAAARLEQLYGSLPDGLSEQVLEEHALPRSLGASIDLRVLCAEAGADLDLSVPSVATPLLLALDQAGVRSTFDLLDAPALSVNLSIPSTMLGDLASGLSRIAAIATAARLATVALLVDPQSLVAREVLLDLYDDRRARVPAGVAGRLADLALA